MYAPSGDTTARTHRYRRLWLQLNILQQVDHHRRSCEPLAGCFVSSVA